MAKRSGVMVLMALLLAAQGCSDDDGGSNAPPTGTCVPTPQTTANTAGAIAHCEALVGALCDRGFGDCAAEFGLTSYFSSAEQCRSVIGAECADFWGYSAWYDAACGAECVAYLRTASCSALWEGDEPQACAMATGDLSVPPPPPPPPPPDGGTGTCIPLTAGTLTDTISAADPIYDGGHARTYCISLAAGQSIAISTAPPSSGTPIVDTVLHLLDPSGTVIAYNDDPASGFYARIPALTVPVTGTYRVVVSGFSTYDVGSYQLSVTVY